MRTILKRRQNSFANVKPCATIQNISHSLYYQLTGLMTDDNMPLSMMNITLNEGMSVDSDADVSIIAIPFLYIRVGIQSTTVYSPPVIVTICLQSYCQNRLYKNYPCLQSRLLINLLIVPITEIFEQNMTNNRCLQSHISRVFI